MHVNHFEKYDPVTNPPLKINHVRGLPKNQTRDFSSSQPALNNMKVYLANIFAREPQRAVGNEEITIKRDERESNLLASEVIECTFLVKIKAAEILLIF